MSVVEALHGSERACCTVINWERIVFAYTLKRIGWLFFFHEKKKGRSCAFNQVAPLFFFFVCFPLGMDKVKVHTDAWRWRFFYPSPFLNRQSSVSSNIMGWRKRKRNSWCARSCWLSPLFLSFFFLIFFLLYFPFLFLSSFFFQILMPGFLVSWVAVLLTCFFGCALITTHRHTQIHGHTHTSTQAHKHLWLACLLAFLVDTKPSPIIGIAFKALLYISKRTHSFFVVVVCVCAFFCVAHFFSL